MNWRATSLDGIANWCWSAAEFAILLVMCDAKIKRLPTSFSIENIIFTDDKPHQPHLPGSRDHLTPAVVRPWEMNTTSSIDETCLRLTAAAAALTLCHWQTINCVSPLSALYNMTTRNFVGSLNGDILQGRISCLSIWITFHFTTTADFDAFARSVTAVRNSEKCSIITHRESTASFPKS